MKLKFPVQFKISDFKNGWEFKFWRRVPVLECSAVRSPCTTFSVKVFLSFFLLKSFHYSFQAQRTELFGRGRIFQILDRGATPIFFKILTPFSIDKCHVQQQRSRTNHKQRTVFLDHRLHYFCKILS